MKRTAVGRVRIGSVVTLGLFAAFATLLVARPQPVRAQDDPGRDAQLFYFEGKFREGDELLAKAPPEVRDDVKVRTGLAEAAQKFLKGKTGEDRRTGLEAVKRSYGVVADAHPENGPAVAGAVLAAKELADLDIARKQMDAAKAQATWALQLGERAAAAGLTPEVKAALGAAYGLRASVVRKVDLLGQISADYRKGAELLEQAAEGHDSASIWLAAAADLRFKEAVYIHDSIPLPTETRDDEAMKSAIALARRSCEAKSPADGNYWAHLHTLLVAHEWKLAGDRGRPFMQPLAPPVEGLKLLVPRGVQWTRSAADKEWDLSLTRQYEGETNAVQILVKARDPKAQFGGRAWAQLSDLVPLLYESRHSGFSEVVFEQAPAVLGGDKKGKGGIWHFQVGGIVSSANRPQRLAEWIWAPTDKKDVVWNVKILDWRRPSSIEEPDIAEFVASAIGGGLWPPGSAPPPEPENPKKKPPKKK